MKKEIAIFLIILIILAFIQHTDLLEHPIERFQQLPESGAYGLGAAHPLVFALLGYVILGILRLLYRGVKKIFKRDSE